jgi:hypothetical protein
LPLTIRIGTAISPETVTTLADRSNVSAELKRKIFFDNPQRFYGFKISPGDFGV